METIPGIEIRNVNHARLEWRGDHRFEGGRDGAPPIVIDSDTKAGPGPVDTFLCALAACTAVDVLDILTKRRTPPEAFAVEVDAARAKATPARVIGWVLHYRLDSAAIDRVHAERAVELALTKYCSVRDSIDHATPVRWHVTLNGEAGEVKVG
jgi:putative redox protein